MRIGYSFAIKITLPHGVEPGRVAVFGVSSFHGKVDSSLRQSQIGLMQDGLRDNQLTPPEAD